MLFRSVQPVAAQAVVAPAPAPVAPAVDYDRIAAQVRAEQQTWLNTELKKRDAAHTRELQQIQGQLVYIDSVQRSMLRDTLENASSIQLLAQKYE